MENRDRDNMRKNTPSGDVNRSTSSNIGKKSDSESSFGQNIGRSEDWNEEPSRSSGSSGSSGWQSESGRSSGSSSNLGEQSDVSERSGGSSSEGSE